MHLIEQLQQMVESALDDTTGCPWMQQQNWQSIGRYSLEEVYELLGAIDRLDYEAIQDELADMCLHLIIYCSIAKKEQAFEWDDIVQSAINKQLQRRRSPDNPATTAEEAHSHWQQKKWQQKQRQFDAPWHDIPLAMPSLMQAARLDDSMRMMGLELKDRASSLSDFETACSQLKCAAESSSDADFAQCLGDVLFLSASLSRHVGFESENVLRQRNLQTMTRLAKLEESLRQEGLSLQELSPEQKLSFWQKTQLDIL